jgi:nitrous oxidase accessory protein NosD
MTKFCLGVLFITLVVFNVTEVLAATFNVSSASALSSALKKANGGDTIAVAAGVRLGNVTINSAKYSSTVTIRSASSSQPAYFKTLYISYAQNLKISQMKFDSAKADALIVKHSQNVTIDGNDFINALSGIKVATSTHVRVANNDIVNSLYDGMMFVQVEDVMIENNRVTVKSPSGAKHVDMIQFANESDKPSKHITIRNNIMSSATSVHGIYMGNKAGQAHRTNKSYWYSDILIQNNQIETRALQGICVSTAFGVDILDNVVKGYNATVLVDTDDTDVTILRNKTAIKPRAGHVETSWQEDTKIPKSWNVDF